MSEEPAEPAELVIPELLPVRMLNEFVYCPRLFYLEWVQGEWADNVFTVEGTAIHSRADRPTRDPPAVEEERPFRARSVDLSSDRLGLTTKVDVLESDGKVTVPVEYKRGKPPRIEHQVYDPERVQVCAQALILRDNGYEVPHAEVYFSGSRQRVTVPLDEALIRMTELALEEAKRTATQPQPPPPLRDSPKCNGCSLVGICLPDEVHALEGAEASSSDPLRRLHPARDDALPLYVQRGGTKLGLRGGRLVVREKDKVVSEARLEETSQVAVFGGVQVSTQAVRRLLQRDIPLVYFSAGGWFYGWTRGLGQPNVQLRREQFRAADDPERCLELARRFVRTKIANQRTILRRNHSHAEKALSALSNLRKRADQAASLAELLGIEGTAARHYFRHLPDLVQLDTTGFSEQGRSRRPPRDGLSALLSFVYSLLTKDWTVTCAAVGLDPQVGFYHQVRPGKPALALDLMEEFRPIVADSVVLAAVNNGSVREADFLRRGTAVAMRDGARKRLIGAYERRLDELVTHPVFGYRISYRRTFEVQARLLGRFLTGEISEYPEFRTR